MSELLFDGVRLARPHAESARKLVDTIIEIGDVADRGFELGVSSLGQLTDRTELIDPEREPERPVVIGYDDVGLFGGYRLALREVGKELGVHVDETALDADKPGVVAWTADGSGSISVDLVSVEPDLQELHGITSSTAYRFTVNKKPVVSI